LAPDAFRIVIEIALYLAKNDSIFCVVSWPAELAAAVALLFLRLASTASADRALITITNNTAARIDFDKFIA